MTSDDAGRRTSDPAAATKAPATVAGAGGAPPASGGFGRFVASLIGHLAFAALVVAGVLAYQSYPKLLGQVADTVCTDEALGQYRTSPGTTLAGRASAPAAASSPEPTASADGQDATRSSSGVTSEPAKAAPPASAPAAATPAEPAKVAAMADPRPAMGAVPAEPRPEGSAAPAAAEPPVTQPGPSGGERAELALPTPPAAKPVTSLAQPPAVPRASQPAPEPTAAVTPADAGPSLEASTAQVAVAPESTPPSSPAERLSQLWQEARSAYQAGRADAIETYRALARDFPDVPDLPGELGNIYYTTGRLQEAAEQYYEAGLRHLRGAQPGTAACIATVLKRLNPVLADKLASQLTAPCPTDTKDAAAGARSG